MLAGGRVCMITETDKQMLYGREITEAAMCRPVNETQGTFIKVGGQHTTQAATFHH